MDTASTPDTPQVPAATAVEGVPAAAPEADHEAITQPAKLLRIATMVRELLEDTRQGSLDEPGRIRLRQIYERAIGELEDVLSPDPQEEPFSLAPPAPRRPPGTPPFAGAADAGRAHRRRDPRRAGPAGRVARGPVPRDPGRAVLAADGRTRPVRGAPAPRAPRVQRRPAGARLGPVPGPVPLATRQISAPWLACAFAAAAVTSPPPAIRWAM